jgi:hypothetical protein
MFMRLCAWLLFIVSGIGLVYGLLMDISVPVPGEVDQFGTSARVVNIGLMHDRQITIIISLVGMVTGILIEGFALILKSKKPEPAKPSQQRIKKIMQDDWQNQNVVIDPQRAEWAARVGRDLR